jgi:hypothetical protein
VIRQDVGVFALDFIDDMVREKVKGEILTAIVAVSYRKKNGKTGFLYRASSDREIDNEDLLVDILRDIHRAGDER